MQDKDEKNYRNSLQCSSFNLFKMIIIQTQVTIMSVIIETLNITNLSFKNPPIQNINKKNKQCTHTSPRVVQGPMQSLHPYSVSRDYTQKKHHHHYQYN